MTAENGIAHLLITDDDKIIRRICQNALEPVGYKLSMAENGQVALDMIMKEDFDLILTDMEMPVMDGMTLLTRLQDVPHSPPVIMFTAHAYVPHAVMALTKGAYDFITKPFMTDALLGSVRRCLENSRLKKEVESLRSVKGLIPFFNSIVESMDPPKVTQMILTKACEMLKAEGGSVLLYDDKKKDLVVKAAGGPFSEKVLGKKLSPGERVAGQSIKEKKVITLQGPLSNDARFKSLDAHQNIYSSMTAPMILEKRPYGVLCVKRINQGKQFNAIDEEVFTAMANFSALALSNSFASNKIKYI